MKALSVVCLNIRGGGGLRWDNIVAFVEALNADVVIFTEWREAGQRRAEAWSSSRGMRSSFANDGATKNGVFVATKGEYTVRSVTPVQNSPGTLLRVQFNSWILLACYFPQGKVKAAYFDACQQEAKAAGNQPLLVVGDLNTGNQTLTRRRRARGTRAVIALMGFRRRTDWWTSGGERTAQTLASGPGAAPLRTNFGLTTLSPTNPSSNVSIQHVATITSRRKLISAITVRFWSQWNARDNFSS
jgi:hypothetical protein